MSKHLRLWIFVMVGASVAWIASGIARQAPRKDFFHGGVVLVPIEVRVLDRDGNPVTDLKQSEFTVFEDGIQQPIAEFSTRSYQPTSAPSDPKEARREEKRTVAFLLGRGRLNRPSHGLDGLIEFARNIAPEKQSLVVSAFRHATEPRDDRDAVVRLLEWYRDKHEAIDGLLDRDMARAHGPTLDVSGDTRRAVDSFFDRQDLPSATLLPSLAERTRALDYNDWDYFVGTIDYLRHIAGQKHLIVLLQYALALPSDFMTLARRASSSRITVWFVQVGGVRSRRSLPNGRFNPEAFGTASIDLTRFRDDLTFAEETGGSVWFYRDARDSLTYVRTWTSFEYLIGYYPSVAIPTPKTYRKLHVTVGRSATRVLYRRGYDIGSLDSTMRH